MALTRIKMLKCSIHGIIPMHCNLVTTCLVNQEITEIY